MKPLISIGIDPGTSTGLAIWSITKQNLLDVRTVKLHQAFDIIRALGIDNYVFVRIEDARLRKWFGANSAVKKQGAGAIKIQCKIWEDFLIDSLKTGLIKGYDMQHPIRGGTKLLPAQFRLVTKYIKKTSNHGRDAAMLVFQENEGNLFRYTKLHNL